VYSDIDVIQTEFKPNLMREVLDTHYLSIQLSGMFLEFLVVLVVCLKHGFPGNNFFKSM
jgi:hypothetical protein